MSILVIGIGALLVLSAVLLLPNLLTMWSRFKEAEAVRKTLRDEWNHRESVQEHIDWARARGEEEDIDDLEVEARKVDVRIRKCQAQLDMLTGKAKTKH